MKKIYIHIGWHKTGSTSVQNFLSKNRSLLCNQQSVYYPLEGSLGCAHHTIAWSFQGRKKSPWGNVDIPAGGAKGFITRLVDSADQNQCQTIIISSEDFCTFKKNEIQTLRDALLENGLDPYIVAYIRRQDQFIESAYNMKVKWWGSRLTKTFDEYLKSNFQFTRFTPILREWASAFGQTRVIIRPFSHDLLKKGDVRIDFCDVVSIDSSNLEVTLEKVNDSLANKTIEFMRITNNLNIPRNDNERIVRKLFQYDKEKDLPNCVFFTPEERVTFMSALDHSNSELIQFDEKIDFSLPCVEKLPAKNVDRLTPKEFRDIFHYLSSDMDNLT